MACQLSDLEIAAILTFVTRIYLRLALALMAAANRGNMIS